MLTPEVSFVQGRDEEGPLAARFWQKRTFSPQQGFHRATLSGRDRGVNNNDVLRRLRYTFDFEDQQVIDIFALGGLELSRATISNYLKKDEHPECEPLSNAQLSAFLNGLIIHHRGPRQEGEGPPPLEHELNNNDKLRKLKIALAFKEADMLEVMALSGMPLSRPELSALFRKPNHQHYRACQDQLLRNFLRGLQIKTRG